MKKEIIETELLSHPNEYKRGFNDGENYALEVKHYSPSVAKKLLIIRDALIKKDYEEAYHQLYSIASPNFDKNCDEVWDELEKIAKQK